MDERPPAPTHIVNSGANRSRHASTDEASGGGARRRSVMFSLPSTKKVEVTSAVESDTSEIGDDYEGCCTEEEEDDDYEDENALTLTADRLTRIYTCNKTSSPNRDEVSC